MGFNRAARRTAVVGVLGVAACAWSGCSGKKATEFVAGVSSQVQVPRDLASIIVTVSVNGTINFNQNYPVYDGKVRLPKTLGVVNSSTPTGTPITISVVGYDAATINGTNGSGGQSNMSAFNNAGSNTVPTVGLKEGGYDQGGGGRVLRSSRQPYVPDQIIYVPMPLHFSCYDVDCGPNGGQPGTTANCASTDGANPCTCKGGLCVAPDTDVSTLPPYNDSLTDTTANTCFRVFTDTDSTGAKQPGCMDYGITPLTIDAAKCIYALPDSPSTPAGAPAPTLPAPLIQAALTDTSGHLNSQNLNVRAVFDNYVSEVLDDEGTCGSGGAVEGYCTFPNAPQMFQLAPGLCPSSNPLHKLTLLEASAGCPAKTQLQPICDDSTQGPPQPTLSDGGNSTDGGCNIGVSLTPAPSALYILWDRTSGMKDFFGSQALSQVLGLSLGDPVFAQTQVAFSYTPSQQANCGAAPTANTYTSPLIPFTPSAQGQVEIANSLLNEGNEDGGVASLEDGGLILPPETTPWYLESALDGAYTALQTKAINSKEAFNRLAVMLFFDRDVLTNGSSSDCGPTHKSAAQEAQEELAFAGIETYVVYLKNQNYPAGAPAQWATDAQQLAGGLSSTSQYFFNASVGNSTQLEETQALALASVVADLGSCVYEIPPGIGPDAVLSYPDPTSLAVSYAQNNSLFIKYDSVTNGPSCANDDPKTNPTWVYDNRHIRVCQNTCAAIVQAIELDQEHTATVNITRAQQGLAPIATAGITVSGLEPCESSPTDASIVESGSVPNNYDAGLPSFDAAVSGEDAGPSDAGEDGGG